MINSEATGGMELGGLEALPAEQGFGKALIGHLWIQRSGAGATFSVMHDFRKGRWTGAEGRVGRGVIADCRSRDLRATD